MNWKSVLGVSLFGVIIGLLNVYGLVTGLEWLVWVIIAFVSAFIIEKTAVKILVTQGFLAGFFQSLLNGIIVFIFWNQYILNHAKVLEDFENMPESLDPKYFSIIAAVLIGLFYGLFIGLVVFIIRKFKTKSKPAGHGESN